jgi:hypothetical protein
VVSSHGLSRNRQRNEGAKVSPSCWKCNEEHVPRSSSNYQAICIVHQEGTHEVWASDNESCPRMDLDSNVEAYVSADVHDFYA